MAIIKLGALLHPKGMQDNTYTCTPLIICSSFSTLLAGVDR
jgi:hypothetical protein